MRLSTKLVLAGVVPVALTFAIVAVVCIVRGEWRPLALLVSLYAIAYLACVILASAAERRRRKQRWNVG